MSANRVGATKTRQAKSWLSRGAIRTPQLHVNNHLKSGAGTQAGDLAEYRTIRAAILRCDVRRTAQSL